MAQNANNQIYTEEQLKSFSAQVFNKVGVPEDQAKIISDALVQANINGTDSHGMLRLPLYIERIQKDLVSADTSYVIEKETDTMALIDGQDGMGQVLATAGMELAIKKAKKSQIATVAIKNSHHFGTAAYYSNMAAEQGMIGIVVSNTPPLMPPIGGAEPKLGNNPLSMAAPSSTDFPVVLDMALSQAAFGKIQLANNNKQEIPLGWGIDSAGKPTTDPAEVMKSRLLSPTGGPKGYGLAFFVDILCGVLTNSKYGTDVTSLFNFEKKNGCGHFFIVIDVEAFLPKEVFEAALKQMIQNLKETKLAEGVSEILIPGEIEYRVAKDRKENGIPIDNETLTGMKKLAEQYNIEFK